MKQLEGKRGCGEQRAPCCALRSLIQNSLGEVKGLSRVKGWEAKVLRGNLQSHPLHKESQHCRFRGIHAELGIVVITGVRQKQDYRGILL